MQIVRNDIAGIVELRAALVQAQVRRRGRASVQPERRPPHEGTFPSVQRILSFVHTGEASSYYTLVPPQYCHCIRSRCT